MSSSAATGPWRRSLRRSRPPQPSWAAQRSGAATRGEPRALPSCLAGHCLHDSASTALIRISSRLPGCVSSFRRAPTPGRPPPPPIHTRRTQLTVPVGAGRSLLLQAHLFEVLAGVRVCRIERDTGGPARPAAGPPGQRSSLLLSTNRSLASSPCSPSPSEGVASALSLRRHSPPPHLPPGRLQPGLHARVRPASQPAAAAHDQADAPGSGPGPPAAGRQQQQQHGRCGAGGSARRSAPRWQRRHGGSAGGRGC